MRPVASAFGVILNPNVRNEFGILNLGIVICLLFRICYLEFAEILILTVVSYYQSIFSVSVSAIQDTRKQHKQ